MPRMNACSGVHIFEVTVPSHRPFNPDPNDPYITLLQNYEDQAKARVAQQKQHTEECARHRRATKKPNSAALEMLASIVRDQLGQMCTMEEATQALREYDYDVADAIMKLAPMQL
jgi:NACalpha-BTF3-like transcription factor